MSQESRERSESQAKYQAGLAYMIQTLMFSGPLTGLALGWIINKAFAIAPPWDRRTIVICVVIGTVSGIRESIKVLRKLAKSQASDDKR